MRVSPMVLTSNEIVSMLLSLTCLTVVAEPLQIPYSGQEDTCPVCGMFVAKYPEWVATVVYKDGHVHHFDGAKDLFKYLLELPRWAADHKSEDIRTIVVTEYYKSDAMVAAAAALRGTLLGAFLVLLTPLSAVRMRCGKFRRMEGLRVLS